MSQKVKGTWMVLDTQKDWIDKKAGELGVDKSLIVRRALAYYEKEGIKRDKLIKKIAEGEV